MSVLHSDPTPTHDEIVELSSADSHAMFETLCHDLLGISASEFKENYEQGRLSALDDSRHDEVSRLLMLLPFAR